MRVGSNLVCRSFLRVRSPRNRRITTLKLAFSHSVDIFSLFQMQKIVGTCYKKLKYVQDPHLSTASLNARLVSRMRIVYRVAHATYVSRYDYINRVDL